VVAKVLFWSCLLLITHSYVLYPLILLVVSRFSRSSATPAAVPDHTPDEMLPRVTMLFAAHNEAKVIQEKVQNCLALEYPADKLRVVIASDGSEDGTNEIVAACKDPRIQLVAYPQRRGKIATLNATLPLLEDEIIVMSDADAFYETDAIRQLVRHFADERIGLVCGEVEMVAPNGGGSGEGLYWKYETLLKRLESRLGFLLGASGCIFAIRKSLLRPLPPTTINEDFVIAMKVLEAGHRVCFEPKARANHPAAATVQAEMCRKARIGAGGFQAIGMTAAMLNPLRGMPALGYWSHKVLRWVVPFLMLGMLAANLALATEPLYALFLIPQLLAYAIGLQGLLPRPIEHRLVRPVRYFFLMNLALFIGFFRFVRGTQRVTWERAAR
jgi:cellulose synthase/poly-beta-1,6-N-acetylglucosamine synthase-like glycosyltransferase